MIDMRHELVKLIDWALFEAHWIGFFPSHIGRPVISPRLVAGLLYLQHAYQLSGRGGCCDSVPGNGLSTPILEEVRA
jgi:hypothetical protein